MKQRSNRKFEANEAADTRREIPSYRRGSQPGGLADHILSSQKMISPDQKNGSTCVAIASTFETSDAPALRTDRMV